MVDHEGQTEGGQLLEGLLDAPGRQLLLLMPAPENVLLPLPIPLFAGAQLGFEFVHPLLQSLPDAPLLVRLSATLALLQGE
ncbi:hypothetical protein [Azotobacter beijerinckii]|uniref:Uncharacterized protein n=1 Tax=Azotobacter beijerinckii TaxID=170623 RepID=A0A1I4EWT8_9GAMM|nr:hypothetical protein SAMN04244571_03366 [Azotobacter beijerinckii]SFL08611.1 hypothetical protein SAMN04244574_03046 [Azotobacter beijerinckii]